LYFIGILAVAASVTISSLRWISTVAILLLIPLGAVLVWRSEGRPLGELGYRLSRGWPRNLGIGLLLGLGIPALFKLLFVLVGWATLTPRGEPLQDLITSLPPVLIRMMLVVGLEELVFRGFFPQALSRSTGPWPAILLSSSLWGATHLGSMVSAGLSGGAILLGMTTFLAWGITLSLCFLIGGKSLWLPYGLHLGVNLGFSLAGWYFITQPHAPEWWIGHPAWSPESGLIGPVVWLILALIAYRLVGAYAGLKPGNH
jgi:membrane protease YdiL (CAAX protease family)